jgi:hypothetical protein
MHVQRGTPSDKPLILWCRHQESNPGPTDYKSVALPTELYRLRQIQCVAIHGLYLIFSRHRPRHPVAAFAGPKLRFGFRRLTQLAYTGFFQIQCVYMHVRARYFNNSSVGRQRLIAFRAGRSIPQEHLFLAVLLDHGTGTLARRQCNIDKKDFGLAGPLCDISRQFE